MAKDIDGLYDIYIKQSPLRNKRKINRERVKIVEAEIVSSNETDYFLYILDIKSYAVVARDEFITQPVIGDYVKIELAKILNSKKGKLYKKHRNIRTESHYNDYNDYYDYDDYNDYYDYNDYDDDYYDDARHDDHTDYDDVIYDDGGDSHGDYHDDTY